MIAVIDKVMRFGIIEPVKSTRDQLICRGFAFDDELRKYENLTKDELLRLLRDKAAYKRTIAIRLLPLNKNHIPLLCEMLKTEKKLYTKIELCDALGKYNGKAIPYLIPLLGTIGKNQHRKIALVDINKKSYPLPRDIAARTLIKMGPDVFPALKQLFSDNKNISQIAEAIDATGHITWNYKNYEMEKTLIGYFNKNRGNDFIVWKLVRAFQSFASAEVKAVLEEIIETHKNEVIAQEAKRSLRRMAAR